MCSNIDPAQEKKKKKDGINTNKIQTTVWEKISAIHWNIIYPEYINIGYRVIFLM